MLSFSTTDALYCLLTPPPQPYHYQLALLLPPLKKQDSRHPCGRLNAEEVKVKNGTDNGIHTRRNISGTKADKKKNGRKYNIGDSIISKRHNAITYAFRPLTERPDCSGLWTVCLFSSASSLCLYLLPGHPPPP